MNYLLDTNICIYIIKSRPLSVLDRLQSIPLNQLYLSARTVAELEYGVRKSSRPDQNKEALHKFLLPFTVLDFNSSCAIEYGIIRSELERKGQPIGSLDLLIAAHSKSLNFTLVTNNEREFARVEGLTIENWVM